jgi:hypothetical protein
MKWQDMPWYDKVGEVLAAIAVLVLPILLLFLAEAFK